MKTGREDSGLLHRLRAVTRASHERLDEAFGALDLTRRDDCARFLVAHAIALQAVQPVFARFVAEELDMPAPDFSSMLAADLAERGHPTARLPALDAAEAIRAPGGAAGVCYVIAGSRLGNAVIRAQGYAGREAGIPSRYMEDDTGHAVWKQFGTWIRSRTFGATEAAGVEAAALATFEHFEAAFAVGTKWELPYTDG